MIIPGQTVEIPRKRKPRAKCPTNEQKRLAYLEGFYAYFENNLASSYCGALKVEWVSGWSDATKHCEDIEEDAVEQWEADRQAEEEDDE